MIHFNNKNTLFNLLQRGVAVVTPNNRLSQMLLEEYFQEANQKTLHKPMCLPYRTFITKIYQELIFDNPEQSHPHLLNQTQCHFLWQKIIKANTEITYSTGLLHNVMQAWEYCEQWQINAENVLFHYTPQTRQFQQWWHHFNQKTKELNTISEHQLTSYLVNINAPFKELVWVCFDEFTPSQKQLQDYLLHKGIKQYQYDLKEQNTIPAVIAAKDNKEEYEQLIAWLNVKLEQGESRIGVVVPDLQQESHALQRTLQRHFDPLLFNISLGQPLSAFPLVAHALAWLHLNHKQLEYAQSSLLLQSPYLSFAKAEFIERSHYLQESQLLQRKSCSMATLIQELNGFAPKLGALLHALTPYPSIASVEEWISLFQERLNILGFPGDYGLNSENYQCLNRFNTIFDEFRQLHLVTEQLKQSEALSTFAQIAHNTIFQAQKTNAPIQISGLLEASGCEFNSLWIMGLTSQSLPQKTRLSAFIPPQLQRELAMPHSSPERELLFAQQTLQRLQRSAQEIVLSYPCMQGDTPNLPCSLISQFPYKNLFPTPGLLATSSYLIEEKELYEIPLHTEEQLSGGSSLLGNQAKCPFKAFAEHRLNARTLPQHSEGVDNKEKGKIIHRVMELLWQKLQSQEQLIRINSKQLEQDIHEAIEVAFSSFFKLETEAILQDIERQRVKRVVLSALEWEKQRPSFTIIALEQSYSINLAGLDIRLRVDRLDQVDDNKWVLDYKSNLPAYKPWNEDRPKEPQLLLYVLLDEDINTMLFMQLKAGKITCSGLSEYKHDVAGLSPLKKDQNWSDCKESWRLQLTNLAKEVQQGYCAPQPASPSICQLCDFQNLCRIEEN